MFFAIKNAPGWIVGLTGIGLLLALGCGTDNKMEPGQPSAAGGAMSGGGAGSSAIAGSAGAPSVDPSLCTNPSTAVERFCCNFYAAGQRCAEPPVQSSLALFAVFSPLCQQLPIHKNWKEQATDAFSSCLKDHPCGNKANGECLSAVGAALPPETAQEAELQKACFQKRSTCSSIGDDCSFVRLLSSSAQEKYKNCLDLSCNEVRACLKAAGATGTN